MLGKKVRRRQGAEYEWDDEELDEDEVTDSDSDIEHDDEHDGEGSEQTLFTEEDTEFGSRVAESGSGSNVRTHGLPSFPNINSLIELLPTSLSTPSSLFGSTTRPATRTTPEPYELRHREATVSVKEASDTAARGSFLNNLSIPATMAPRAHSWITLWFLLTAPVILWDASYCFMRCVCYDILKIISSTRPVCRPRSFKGGDLHWIWKPYELYQEVDYVYGVETYNRGDGFTNAQCALFCADI